MRGIKQASPKAIRKLLKKLDEKGLSYKDLLRLKSADRKGNLKKNHYSFSDLKGFLKKYRKVIIDGEEKPFMKLAITGHDIIKITKLPQGKQIGKIKNYLMEKVLEDPNRNTKEWLESKIIHCCLLALNIYKTT